MTYGLGIDLGTSFTSAAISGPHGTNMVPLGPDVVVPSVAYPTPDGALLTGQAALAAATDPALVARGFKRRLGDPTPLVLGGAAYSPSALMAAQLRAVLTTVTAAAGGPPASVVLTCPAIWGPYRRENFAEVPKLAGVTDYRLITEPEAAATHYSAERRLGDGEVVAVYDLGGGTFDTTILRMRAGGMEILGTPEGIEHMGGVDFDESLLAHLDDRLDGAVGALDPSDPAAAAALAAIRAMCVRAKEELSIEPDVTLSVPLPAGPREVTVTRLEFNDMIRPSVQLTADALRRTIGSAGLRPADLSAVLLAGGSSRIPLVSQLLSQEFGRPVRVTLHPKFTVALGAASVATRPSTTAAPNASAAPVPGPRPATPMPRRKWLVPAVAAAVVAVLGVVTTLLLTGDGQTEEPLAAPDSTASTTEEVPPPLRLLDGMAVKPWIGFVSSAENWNGAEITSAGARQGPISAAWDGERGLRVTWHGAPGQMYLQNTADPMDLQSYVDTEGAVVFDVTVHRPPADHTLVGVHCFYPCGGEVVVTNLLRNLPLDVPTTLRLPLDCFAGLDATRVDTAFLVYTGQPFDATFSDIRWEPGAGKSPAATPCAYLR